MKKKFFRGKTLTAGIVIMAMTITMTGCADKEDVTTTTGQTTLVQSQTPSRAAAAKPEEPETTTAGQENPTATYKEPVNMTEAEIKKLSNERQDNYFGGDTNEEGVSLHCLEWQNKYGKYNADFVRYEEGGKNIYLTFDEGYENGYTAKILDVLKEKGVKAVFFCTMPYIKQQPELVQRMIDEGHIVGSHSVTHPSEGMISLSIAEQKEEMETLQKYVADNFNGYQVQLFRYPAGIYSDQSLALMGSLGYTSVFWSFAYADWDVNNQPNEAEALKKCVDKLHPGAIYLLHAVSKTNTNILGDFIEQAREKGYTFKEYY